ncbi:PRC-barrel domain-containing protein [Effusibacillus pohliae]|uniref:PRC-barrel domain-containing protein n=1 Tax=Effusibacillus pohliae TaxID=232270 RepID=UPI000381BF44|nr:PRC-barrel domain-containing protein [Effusibacillus pohliae]
MRRARPWIGLPVIELRNGSRLGQVVDLLFQQDNRLDALLVERDGLFAGQGVVPISDVKSIGEDAVTVESPECIRELAPQEGQRRLLCGKQALVGKELYTENGTVLGTVADVYIASQTDNIVGYEVSDGLLADLTAGRKWMPFSDTLQIGDQIIVKANARLSDLQSDT